MQGTTMQSYF